MVILYLQPQFLLSTLACIVSSLPTLKFASAKMSLTDSPDYFFRPEDKALKMLFPSVESPVHNSFDEFFDGQLYNHSNDEKDGNSPPFIDFFSNDCAEDFSVNKRTATPPEPAPQPWRKGVWCLKSNPAIDLIVGKTRMLNRQAQNFISPTHLVNNDNPTRSPISPSKMKTKPAVANPNAATTFGDGQNVYRNIVRDQTLSPTPMYANLSGKGRMGQCELQTDFQNFHLQMPDNGIYLSSQRASGHREHTYEYEQEQEYKRHHEIARRQVNAKSIARNATVAHLPQSPTKYSYPLTQVSRPVKAMSKENVSQIHVPEPFVGVPQSQVDQLHQLICPNFSSEPYAAPVWTTESLHSSDSSQYSHASLQSAESYQRAFPNPGTQVWTSPPPVTTSVLSPRDRFMTIATPIPRRTHPVLQNQHSLHYEELSMQYENSHGIGRAVSYPPNTIDTIAYGPTTPPTTGVAPYPPLPPYPSELYLDEAQLHTPHKQRTPFSRSPSPSISPTRRSTSRGIGISQRSPTRTDHNHSRRKSIHKPGPIKDTHNYNSTQEDPHHRRARSTSRPPRTPKTPKTPKTPTSAITFGQVDFVNYTPRDSAKLMSDVAPSGSSKTRARREQEAKDKRKRLSEAALQAVRRAGGDVSALERAILV